MKALAIKLAAVAALLAAGTAQAQAPTGGAPAAGAPAAAAPARPPRYIEPTAYDFNNNAGWTSMFDGKTLAGWDGPKDIWRVENGAIVTSDVASNPKPLGPVYMAWVGKDGGDLKDFEFKAEIKLEGERANSGLQFRALMLGKTEKLRSEYESFGYQADFDFGNEQTGALIECCSGPRRGPSPRPYRASKGMSIEVTQAAPNGILLGTIGDAEELKKAIRVGDWNQLHVVVRGQSMFYYMNGRLMSAVVDEDPTRLLSHGRLLIQLEGGGDRKVSYRNLWLKTLP